MTTPDLDTLSLGNPWAHDLDSEAVEWRANYDRARAAMDGAAVELADELARRVTDDAGQSSPGARRRRLVA